MYAIVDCNNFFVSCEVVFNPSLKGKAVVVLSNNDGCVISRSQKAKDLGIKMGQPAFEIKEKNVLFYSSNYVLYGDMSRRVMSVLAESLPNIHVYSIDEAFIDFTGFTVGQIEYKCREIIEKVRKYTGIPVSIGVAPNMTLAKLANRFAKRYKGYKGYCAIDNEAKRKKAIELSKIEDIWGIGRRSSAFLKKQGVVMASDFLKLSATCVKHYMKLPGLRVYRELLGECIIEPRKYEPNKSICVSRSFGSGVKELPMLEEAVSNFASSCAAKLRRQKSVATSITTFIMTSLYNSTDRYYNSHTVALIQPSNNTLEIVQAALRALSHIYIEKYSYKKAGVIVTDISPDKCIQQNLFAGADNSKKESLNKLFDTLNAKYGKKMLRLAVEGGIAEESAKEGWRAKREHLSRCYTTDLSQIMEVKAE